MWQNAIREFNHMSVVDIVAILNANHALTEFHVIQFYFNKRRQKTSSYGDKQIGIVNFVLGQKVGLVII
jgi:hypothetical protein